MPNEIVVHLVVDVVVECQHAVAQRKERLLCPSNVLESFFSHQLIPCERTCNVALGAAANTGAISRHERSVSSSSDHRCRASRQRPVGHTPSFASAVSADAAAQKSSRQRSRQSSDRHSSGSGFFRSHSMSSSRSRGVVTWMRSSLPSPAPGGKLVALVLSELPIRGLRGKAD